MATDAVQRPVEQQRSVVERTESSIKDKGGDDDDDTIQVEMISSTRPPRGSSKRSNHPPRKRCQECKRHEALYVCPGCSIRTCSLSCCRGHKNRTGCTGKRDRTAFLPAGRMTDGILRSDYFFLEEILDHLPRNRKRARSPDPPATTPQQQQQLHQCSSKSNTSAATTSTTVIHDPVHVPNTPSNQARRLVQKAQLRGITLKLMPPIMERHKLNNSWYSNPKDTITWKLEVLVFPEQKIVSFSLSEKEEHIMEHVAKHCGINSDTASSYQLFLKKIPCSSNHPKYIPIDPRTSSLKGILSGETVIEHPTIYCVPTNQINEFPTGSDLIEEVLPTTSSSTPDQQEKCPSVNNDMVMEEEVVAQTTQRYDKTTLMI